MKNAKADKEINETMPDFDKFYEMTQGNAFLTTHGLPLFYGKKKLRLALLYAFGLDDKPEIVERLQDVDEVDIVALCELIHEGNSWEVAFDLIA